MAKPRLTTAQRQAALFGKPNPAPPLVVPPPHQLPIKALETSANSPRDVFAESFDFPEPPKHLKVPGANSAPNTPTPQPGSPRSARYYGFRTRHSPQAAWTKAPGRWKTPAQAAAAAKKAKNLDARLEVQLFAVT